MQDLPGRLWLLLLAFFLAIALAPLTAAQASEVDETSSLNFGREARESTPIINRDPDAPLTEREKVHHVLSRFTFGVTRALLEEVEQMGWEKWLDAQLEARQPEPRTLQAKLAELDTLEMTTQQIVQKYNPPIPKELSLLNRLTAEQRRERARLMAMRDIPREQLKDYVLLSAVNSNNQLRETVCDFWRNHFNVDVSKATVRFYATTWERDVIRAEALGTFKGMFNKQARHPAMLVFLDNYISRGTPQKELIQAAQEAFAQSRDYATAMEAVDIARMKGLNENYGRELMELHSLGVDNYYTQDDVIAVAEALTGWTVQQDASKPIEFQFRPDMHASGARRILNVPIPASPQNGELEGQRVLDLLARHKGCSEFIAYKLCRHFVNDRPSPAMVRRVAAAFARQNKTDLAATYRAIVRDEEFFAPENYQTKFKRPMEFVVSALRITNAEIVETGGLQRALLTLNEPIYQCEDPTGYYDQADVWRDPGIMAARWQFGIGLGMGWVPGVKIPDSFWEGLESNNPLQWKEALAKRILPMGYTEQTDAALDKVIAKYAKFNPEPEQLGRYIVGVLIGSPEFQRQ